MYKCGYVAIVGSPNAGKSTLLNELLDAKIAITSDKVGTTRNMIRGIYNDGEAQIIFVDTPGINTPQNKLQVYMKNQVDEALRNVDVILYVIDAKIGIRKKEEEIIAEIAKKKDVPKIVCLNKIDLVSQDKAVLIIEKLQQKDIFDNIIAISLKEHINQQSVIEILKDKLPEQAPIYSEEEVTDFSTNFYVSEIIREKIMRETFEEIPHGVYVKIDDLEYQENRVYISAIIYTERDSQKGIIIGRGGQMIKTIGQFARKDLENYFNKKVFLDLVVRVDKHWTAKDEKFFELE